MKVQASLRPVSRKLAAGWRVLFMLLILFGAPAMVSAQAVPSHGVEYRGGLWFDGTRFVPRTVYVVEGRFRQRRPARVDSVVDLAGGYVVPPFSDGTSLACRMASRGSWFS